MLRKNGFTVINNAKGSNLTAGVATTLLSACTLGGVVRADYVVLEVDECWSRFIFAEIPVIITLCLTSCGIRWCVTATRIWYLKRLLRRLPSARI